MKKPLIFAGLVLALSACSTESPPAGPITTLAQARTAWADQRLDDYVFDFDRSCFCLPPAVEPVSIEVRSGEIASVVSRQTGEPVPPVENVVWYTVEGMFELIEEAEAGGTSVQVEYDPLGYPARLLIGNLAADAGVEYRLSNLRGL